MTGHRPPDRRPPGRCTASTSNTACSCPPHGRCLLSGAFFFWHPYQGPCTKGAGGRRARAFGGFGTSLPSLPFPAPNPASPNLLSSVILLPAAAAVTAQVSRGAERAPWERDRADRGRGVRQTDGGRHHRVTAEARLPAGAVHPRRDEDDGAFGVPRRHSRGAHAADRLGVWGVPTRPARGRTPPQHRAWVHKVLRGGASLFPSRS